MYEHVDSRISVWLCVRDDCVAAASATVFATAQPNKKYPRDSMVSGRIRVRLTRPDGSFENPEIKSRKELMVKMAELIPKLQSRKVRLEKEAEAAKQAASASGAGSGATAAASSKKKGKKKGRR